MSVVARAATLEHRGLVSVDFGKITLSMAIETATLENKTAAPVQAVALGALHTRKRRMLVKWLKGRGRIWTHKEMHFLLAALPHQRQGVQSGARLQGRMKDIREGLFGLDEDTVQLELSRGCGGNDVNLIALMG